MYAKDKANNKSVLKVKSKINQNETTMHCELHEIILRL